MIVFPEEITKEHLRTMYCKGDVLFWENFKGKERIKSSYFVLLTKCIDDKFILVRATKQIHYYTGPMAVRLAHDIVLIKADETTTFPQDTILDLTWMDFFSVEDLYKLLGSDIRKIGKLPANIIKRINDYVFIANTVSPSMQKLILQS